MKYDFTTVQKRGGQDCLAEDHIPYEGAEVLEGFDRIPMWIADMSFVTAPFIRETVKARLDVPHFGYFRLSDDYFNAVIRWQKNRNGIEGLTKEDIGYENGVLGGVSSAIQAFTTPGEKILLHSPTYVGFTHVLQDTGRVAEHSPLVRDENGVWRMDFEDMDRRIKENNIHFVIFCSPHNPTGRVWERWEIEKAMEVYAANDCVVVSDEIWSDIILPGNKHIPTQSISEDAKQRTIAFYAPSKTFSLAGLIGSYHIIYNKYYRDRVVRQGKLSNYNECNILSMHALIGAFCEEGEQWTDEMISVIDANVKLACDFLNEKAPGVRVMRPQGTYMLYPDFSGYLSAKGMTLRELQLKGVEHGVIWQDGEPFMMKDTIRMNLALPTSRLQEALDRLDKYVF